MRYFASIIFLFGFLAAQVEERSYPVTAIDPKNTRDYPGGRGEHQLIVYTSEYGRPTTGTNQWGTEATVKNNIVIKIGGNNSAIHKDEYIISGHGRARIFLTNNVRIGSKIFLSDTLISVTFDLESFRIYTDMRRKELRQKYEKIRSHLSNDEHLILGRIIDTLSVIRGDTSVASHLMVDSALYEQGMRLLDEVEYRMTLSPSVEGRGIWHRPKEKSREEIASLMKRYADAGFNMMFVETIWNGETIYPGFITQQKREFTGFDPLRAFIDEGKKYGIEIHAWIHTFFIGIASAGGDTSSVSILAKHPEWQLVKRNGEKVSKAEAGYIFLNPALPEAQEYVASLYKEVRMLYPDISGLQLDYIRYPTNVPLEESSDYGEYSRTEFKKVSGVDPMEINPSDHPEQWAAWQQWREDVITNFVKKIRWENPEVLLSADIFPDIEEAAKTKMQNWSEWANKGYVNALVPMAYSTNADWVGETVTKVRATAGEQLPLYVGLAPSMQMTPLNLLQQIEKCREQNVQGVILFASHSLTDEQLRLLSIGPFRTTARPPQLIYKSNKP
ncbi:MAG: family 10 glycosylhydrolase [Ignavibacteriales bacterium]|nr:family 10 glycosylhydrolase [Ignavibacteriales bacterium]